MAKFELQRAVNTVKVWFGPHKTVNRGYTFEHEFNNEIDAITYYELLQTSVETHIETIRKNAYNEGYKDGRGKKSRKTWFSDCINYLGE